MDIPRFLIQKPATAPGMPYVVLIDLDMPTMDGVTAIRILMVPELLDVVHSLASSNSSSGWIEYKKYKQGSFNGHLLTVFLTSRNLRDILSDI